MATVAKALRLLDCFSPQQGQIGLSELARAAGYDKATTHRLLAELARYGLLEQDPTSRGYRLGPALPRLAALRAATQPRDRLARPFVEGLSAATGETAHLSVLDGDRLVTALVAQGQSHSTRVFLDLGEELPFNATASGLAVLAALSAARREKLLADGLRAVTPDTVTDPEVLRAGLAAVARGGVAQSVGGYEAGVHGVAMALAGPTGEVAGAIAVAVPVSRMTAGHARAIRTALTEAHRAITETWGGRVPTPSDAGVVT